MNVKVALKDVITLKEATQRTYFGQNGPLTFSYPWLAQLAREGRIPVKKSGNIWLTTWALIQSQVKAGTIGQRSKGS